MIREVRKSAPRWVCAAFCLAVSSPGAAAEGAGAANPPPPPPPPPMAVAAPPPPPMPYAICIDYCTRDEEALSFRQCHELCRELVPLPSAAGGKM